MFQASFLSARKRAAPSGASKRPGRMARTLPQGQFTCPEEVQSDSGSPRNRTFRGANWRDNLNFIHDVGYRED